MSKIINHYSRNSVRNKSLLISSFLLAGLALNCLAKSTDTTQNVSVPVWQEPKGTVATGFSLGYGKSVRTGWGKYSFNERKYFHQVLPGLFKRTIVMDSIGGDRGIKWIFTGPNEGFYLIAKGNQLKFYRQYYNSLGFNRGMSKAPVYPQSKADTTHMICDRAIKAIGIELNHKLGLVISINGKEVLQQQFIEDVRRSQVHLTGNRGTLDARVLAPETVSAIVTVSPKETFQTMLGWGGTTPPTAYYELSEDGKTQWWKYIKEYNMLCQREYPVGGALNEDLSNWDDLNYAKAHYYGDNFPNGEVSDFKYNKRIQDMGGFVIFEFWDFPKWIGDDESEYARAMVGYCKEALRKTGKAPRIVGIQNEVDMSEANIKKFVPALRKALDSAGFSRVKIHMANAGNVAKALERVPKYTKNEEVWKAIDYSASNEYDYQLFFTNPDGYDTTLLKWEKEIQRPFLAVEVCTNDATYQTNSYRLALTMGQLYHKNLALANATLIGYCWNILNIEQPSFGQTRSLFVTNPENGFIPVPSSDQLRVFGAYSRRIKEGMVRVKTETNNQDLKVVAFKGAGNLATLVVLNRSLNPVNFTVNWPSIKFLEMEVVDPYTPNIVKPFQGKSVLIEPGAFVTLTNVPLNK